MPLTNDEIFELASTAVRAMLEKKGPEFKFPADLIWQFTPPDAEIPSQKRSSQPGRLLRAGLLAKTGQSTKAQSPQRQASLTTEYCFGPALIEHALPSPTEDQLVASESLSRIQIAMDSEGYVISTAELANFFLAIIVSPLVVLSGISGTGKSLLPRKFAKQTDSLFHAIPVQPQWADNSDLFGYVPTLSPTGYIKGALINGLLDARNNPSKLVLVLLDEMNLAPVEHYFSDFLSVAETRTRSGTHIVTDSLPIELPPAVEGQPDQYQVLRNIGLPANLRVIGTANMDESTHTFSPKVLDRAFTIEFDDPDLTAFATNRNSQKNELKPLTALAEIVIRESNVLSVQEAYEVSQDVFEHISVLLSEIQAILAPAGIKFGYRTRDAILLYLHFWRELQLSEILAGYAALDFCILQKVLPKVSGSGEALVEALDNLTIWLKARVEPLEVAEGVIAEFSGPLARSLQKVESMSQLLNLDGSTRFWGA